MDDLIFLILDLVADLLAWAWPLVGKFWFLIVGYILFKFFGKQGKKWVEEQSKRPAAPAAPQQMQPADESQGRKRVRASAKYEPIAPEELAYEGAIRESAAAQKDGFEDGRGRWSTRDDRAAVPSPQQAAPLVDPREGMKWALIFGQPRSKSPYRPPYARRNE